MGVWPRRGKQNEVIQAKQATVANTNVLSTKHGDDGEPVEILSL